MFENEIAINELQGRLLGRLVADIPDEKFYQPGLGHGHSPAWIVGHLAIAGENGQYLLGGTVAHPQWQSLFGMGSSGDVPADKAPTKAELLAAVQEAYRGLRERAAAADSATLSRPHGLAFFADTPVQTVSHIIALLLTNHFGFHLGQLSSCRREAGFAPLF